MNSARDSLSDGLLAQGRMADEKENKQIDWRRSTN